MAIRFSGVIGWGALSSVSKCHLLPQQRPCGLDEFHVDYGSLLTSFELLPLAGRPTYARSDSEMGGYRVSGTPHRTGTQRVLYRQQGSVDGLMFYDIPATGVQIILIV